jgi:AraC-like DNA-binding protein/GGDEF domain-containing protein
MTLPTSLEELHDLVIKIQPACDRVGGTGSTAVVVILDIDRFRAGRVERGEGWAARQLTAVERIIEDGLQRGPFAVGVWRVKRDVWAVAFAGAHATAVDNVALAFADGVVDSVAARTDVTITAAIGTGHRGPDRAVHSLVEALRVMQTPIAHEGGHRLHFRESHPWRFDGQAREPELWRLVRAGDQAGIINLIRARMAKGEEPNADMLQAWAAVEIVTVRGTTADLASDSTFVPETERMGAIAWLFERELARQAMNLSLQRFELRDAATRPSERLITTIMSFIRANYAADLTLDSVAATFDVSPYYVSHLFRRERGSTFLEFVRTVRAEVAQRLLTETDAPLAEIAERCGYRSVQHFRSGFQRTVGESPTSFRRRVRRHGDLRSEGTSATSAVVNSS